MAIKILSVDDEQDLEVLLTHYFRRKIRKGEYEFSFAHNGLEALKLMVEHPDFDIVLSDINMPEMDGLTLLSKINELRNPAQKCIMVSAYGDMKNMRLCNRCRVTWRPRERFNVLYCRIDSRPSRSWLTSWTSLPL